MPHANNNGVKIYYEVEGQGPPLVLAHGRGGSLQSWRRNGYTDALRNDFQLVLIDARGHGRSDKPHESAAYGLPDMSEDVVAVLNDIGITRGHYFGYSMGGRIGYWLSTHHAERFGSFILGGAAPYFDERDIRDRQLIVEMLNQLLKDPRAALLQRERMLGRALTSGERETFLSIDAHALVALATVLADWPRLTDHDLSLISVPCLVVSGDLDAYHAAAKEAASRIPNAKFVSLAGLNHSQAFERTDLVLPHVTEFLAKVTSQEGLCHSPTTKG